MEKEKFNIQESYGFHFNLIFLNIKRKMEERLKPFDLTHLQFSILMNLHKYNLSTQKEILQYTNGDEASITRLIDRLELKGYIKRVKSKTDKRKKQILLTPSGTSLIEDATKCAIDVNKELVKDLNEDEAKQLLALLQKVHNSLDKE